MTPASRCTLLLALLLMPALTFAVDQQHLQATPRITNVTVYPDRAMTTRTATPSLKPEEIKDDGRLTWRLPLKAGEKREVTFAISVEYPKDREISGL